MRASRRNVNQPFPNRVSLNQKGIPPTYRQTGLYPTTQLYVRTYPWWLNSFHRTSFRSMWLRDARSPSSLPSRINPKSSGHSSPLSRTRETSRSSNLSMHSCHPASKQLSATISGRHSIRTKHLCRSYSNWLSHTSMRSFVLTQS